MNAQGSAFLTKLPGEIRNMVYELALANFIQTLAADDCEAMKPPDMGGKTARSRGLTPPMLLVCKQISKEIAETARCHRQSHLLITVDCIENHPKSFGPRLRPLNLIIRGVEHLPTIKHVKIQWLVQAWHGLLDYNVPYPNGGLYVSRVRDCLTKIKAQVTTLEIKVIIYHPLQALDAGNYEGITARYSGPLRSAQCYLDDMIEVCSHSANLEAIVLSGVFVKKWLEQLTEKLPMVQIGADTQNAQVPEKMKLCFEPVVCAGRSLSFESGMWAPVMAACGASN